MPDLLIEDLEPALIERLRRRAAHNGCSLEEEVRAILEAAGRLPSNPKLSMSEAREISKESRRQLAGRITGDSAELLRENRDS